VREADETVYVLPAEEKKVWRYDPQKGALVFDPAVSRYLDPANPIVQAHENAVFVLNKNKLYRITPRGVDSTQAPALAPPVNRMALSPTGECHFFSAKYIVGLDLLRAFGEKYAHLPPPPVFARSLSFSDPELRFADISRPNLRLPYGNYQLRIECAAPTFFSAFEPPTYEYAAVESESDPPRWTLNEAGNVFNLPLREGANVIYIRARDAYGQTGAPFTIRVYVHAPLYRTFSAYALYALLAMAAAQLFVHYNDKIKQARIEKLEAVVRRRTEEIVKANEELRALNELLNEQQQILQAKNAETQAQNLRLEAQNKLISEQNAELRRQKEELNRQKNQIERQRAEMAEAAPFVEIGEILPIVIHELNNPFAALNGSIEWLEAELIRTLKTAYELLQTLPAEAQRTVWQSLERPAEADCAEIPGSEERKIKRQWARALADAGVAEAEETAERLVRFNPREDWSHFVRLGAPARVAAEIVYKIGLLRKQIRNIGAAADRAREPVENLQAYIKRHPEPLFFDVREPLETFLKFYRYHLRVGGTDVEVSRQQPARIYGLPQLLLQVWRHTVMSAIELLEGKGKIRVEIRDEDDEVVLSVSFCAPALAPEKIALFAEEELSAESGPAQRFYVCRHNVHRLLKIAWPLYHAARPGATTTEYFSRYGVEFFSDNETTGFVVRLPSQNALQDA
ncbi:MAG: hypothetical protein RMM53_05355, partial [Bacteroidia bacterium]|nr:hypothetical protein [Bacteroidia bacterium]